MNIRKILSVIACLVCLLSAGAVLAQTPVEGSGDMAATRDYTMTDAEFRGVLEQALKERDQLAAAAEAGGGETGVSSLAPLAEKEQEEPKKYRYEGRAGGTVFGADLPQRTFNNIDYPY